MSLEGLLRKLGFSDEESLEEAHKIKHYVVDIKDDITAKEAAILAMDAVITLRGNPIPIHDDAWAYNPALRRHFKLWDK